MKKKILIVDDEEALSKVISTILEEDNYEVKTAVNGKDALEKLAAYLPDLILTDVNMPEMDGEELCKKIRESETYMHIPIIACSGRDNGDIMIKAGANDYLSKPFKIENLENKLKQYLGE